MMSLIGICLTNGSVSEVTVGVACADYLDRNMGTEQQVLDSLKWQCRSDLFRNSAAGISYPFLLDAERLKGWCVCCCCCWISGFKSVR